MKCYPIIAVEDVEASSQWYREILGLTSAHGGPEFEMLMADGALMLALQRKDTAHHPVLEAPGDGRPGQGVLIYFSVSDLATIHERARAMGAEVVHAPRDNPLAHTTELGLRDPDGYRLTVSQRMS